MMSVVLDYLQFTTMSLMRCAAHSSELAICDGLKIDTDASLINKILRNSPAARTPKINAILKRKMYKRAILDQATKRGNTHLMVERFLELKDALVDVAYLDVCLSEPQWNDDVYCAILFSKTLQNCSFDAWNILKEVDKNVL